MTMNPLRLTLGLILLALGALLLFERAGYGDAGAIVGAWWPLVIVLLGGLQWVRQPRSMGPVVVVLIGLILLVEQQNLVPGGVWNIVWPLALIALGAWLLLRPAGPWRALSQPSEESDIDRFVAFGGLDIVNHAPAFRTGTLSAVFGGIKADLREAQLAPEGGNLDVTAAFGGVEVLVPTTWRVIVTGSPLFGGIEDKTRQNGIVPEDAPVLQVHATAVFGGVEVKH